MDVTKLSKKVMQLQDYFEIQGILYPENLAVAKSYIAVIESVHIERKMKE